MNYSNKYKLSNYKNQSNRNKLNHEEKEVISKLVEVRKSV